MPFSFSTFWHDIKLEIELDYEKIKKEITFLCRKKQLFWFLASLLRIDGPKFTQAALWKYTANLQKNTHAEAWFQ